MSSNDPRPARTRTLLFETLLGLLAEKRWERIRVQDVLDRSGVGRSTFYTYFDNKFDLLTASIPDVVVFVGDESSTLAFFQHVEEMASVMRPLMTQPVLGEMTEVFERSLVAAWTDYLTAQAMHADPGEIEVTAVFLSGACVSVARQWLRTDCSDSSELMAQRFTRLAGAAVASLASSDS